MSYKKEFNPNPQISFFAPEDQPEKLKMNLNTKAMQTLGVKFGARFVRYEIIELGREGIFRIINDPKGETTIKINTNNNGTISAGSLRNLFQDGDAFVCEKIDDGIQFIFKYRRQ